MSIVCIPREYPYPLHKDIQKLLDDISDFEFTTPDGQVFNMSDINKSIPIYLDKEEIRIEEHKMTRQELNEMIDNLKAKCKVLDNRDSDEFETSHTRQLLNALVETKARYGDDHKTDDIVTIRQEISLNGYYTRNGKSHDTEIVLMMETLGNDSCNAEDVVITLVHEMFHAFYDYDLSRPNNYIPFVEEPLTEYAMLKFMEACKIKYPKLFDKAKKKVQKKQYSLGIAHYGFGYYLWNSGSDYFHWIDEFRKAKYSISESAPEYQQYAKPFSRGVYPFVDEYLTMKWLRYVLLYATTARSAFLPLAVEPEWKESGNTGLYAIHDKTLYLDGAFLHMRTLRGRKPNTKAPVKYIVLWDHFISDDFDIIKKLVFEKKAALILSPRNIYYVKKDNAIYDKNMTALFYFPETETEFDVPDTLTRITPSAFLNCVWLEKILSNNTNIGTSANTYKDCKSFNCWEWGPFSRDYEIIYHKRLLCVSKDPSVKIYPTTSVYLSGKDVNEIDGAAFNNCTFLEEATLPDTLLSIYSSAFNGCTSLKKITFKGATPPETDKPFERSELISTCTIYVPKGSGAGYGKIFPSHTIEEY